MIISDIYAKYNIPSNLQAHMLRVAAVAHLICSNWKEKDVVDTNRVTKTMLVHDAAKIVNFDLSRKPHLKLVQAEFIKIYGADEEVALMKIVKELELEEKGRFILEQMPRVNLRNQIPENKWELKVAWYADFRVAPEGVTSCDERLDELIARQKNRGVAIQEIQRLEGIKKYCKILENQLQEKVNINLNLITNNSIESQINRLKQLVY